MKTNNIVAALVLVASLAALALAQGQQDAFKPLEGKWIGKVQKRTIELTVQADGQYVWKVTLDKSAVSAPGETPITREGNELYLTIGVIQEKPLNLRVSEDGKSIKLIGANAFEATLTRK